MCHAVEIICWKVGDVTRTHIKTLAGDTLWLTALSLVNAGCNSKTTMSSYEKEKHFNEYDWR